MKIFYLFTFIFLLLCVNYNCLAQFTLKGNVVDVTNQEGLYNASVQNPNQKTGTNTDAKGNFILKKVKLGDTLIISKVGYIISYRVVESEDFLKIEIQKQKKGIEEIKIAAKGNRAWGVLKKVQEFKDQNNPYNDSALRYQVYNNIVLNLQEFDKLKGSATAIKKIIKSYREKNPDADTSKIPVFISEAVSDFYVRNNPYMTKEIIKQTQIKTLGLDAEGIVNELVGSSFQQVNFYDERVRILGKDFTSPISGAWKTNFKYLYLGVKKIDEVNCYKISFTPSNAKDIMLSGEMYIDTTTYALYKIKTFLDGRANINFVTDFTITQYFDKSETYPKYFPTESIIDIGVSANKKNGVGMRVHASTSASNIVAETPRALAFYIPATERVPESTIKADSFWNQVRSQSEIAETKQVINQITSIENLPIIKTIDHAARFLASGWAPTKSTWQIGSSFNLFAVNSVEGYRYSIGLRARDIANKKLAVQGYIAYGTKDKQMKYKAQASYILSTKPWIKASIAHENDIRRLGITTLMLQEENLSTELFQLSSHWGKLRKAYLANSYSFNIFHEVKPGITHKLSVMHERMSPLFTFQYHEKDKPQQPPVDAKDIINTEVNYEWRIAPGEVVVRNNTKRAVKLKKPRERNVYVFRYTYGLAGKQRLFTYHKFYGEINRNIKFNKFGNGAIKTSIAYTPSTIPFPLLFIQIGNPTPIMSKFAFNTMNFFEFTSDKYLRLQYTHDFNGYIINRIPIVKKSNLREHLTVSSLWGELSEKNIKLIPGTDSLGAPIIKEKALYPNEPFIEAGLGFSNIFKVLRLDVFRRFTYINDPHVRLWQIKASVKVGL
jgi:hypothetical protein